MRTSPVEPATHPSAKGLWIEALRDQHQVLIRPVSRSDRQAEREFIETLSPESRRFRFLGQMSCPSEALLDDLINVDQINDVAFAAIAGEEDRSRIVGIAR